MKTLANLEPKWWRRVDWTRTLIRGGLSLPILILILVCLLIWDGMLLIAYAFGWACKADWVDYCMEMLDDQVVWMFNHFGPTMRSD